MKDEQILSEKFRDVTTGLFWVTWDYFGLLGICVGAYA